YTHDWIRPFISVGDGAGLKVFSRETGLFASGGIDFGESRKRGDNRRLEGTGTIDNLFKYFAKVGIETTPFDFFVCANYFRIETEYAQKDRNKKYDAFLFSPRVITGYPVFENLIFQLETGLTIMNESFAEAYHGIRYDTKYHTRYRASAGLHDAYAEMTIVFMPFDAVSVIGQGRYARLLGDAGRSPLTDKKNMFEGKLFAAYSFFP
ncbi:MAG TPA: MipA/OmpV family protein, partial [Spirochaetota bacterium]|nr:MipA/OmpV family protein [Spirochaetota bacterium]